METTTKLKLTPRDFFVQLGVLAALYTFSISFLVFVFNLIDSVFPVYGYSNNFDPYSATMRAAISVLIVSFPLFLWLLNIYRKILSNEPEKKELAMRRWFMYLTLFITGFAICVDLIVLVNKFLSGTDLTTQFLLKVASVILVTGAVFFSCIRDIRNYWDDHKKQAKIYSAVVSAVILLILVLGFIVIGSPSHQRKVGYDIERVNSLQNIQSQIVFYYQQKAFLPGTLEIINDPISGFVVPLDPLTKQPFDYSIKKDLTFELCANFDLPSKSTEGPSPVVGVPTKPVYFGVNDNWQHDAGRVCFERTIDKDLYPININKVK